jgi:hypothetical protein
MRIKNTMALVVMSLALCRTGATDYDCEFCSRNGPRRDYTGYPACQEVVFSSGIPHCVDLGDVSPDVARLSPKSCIWVESDELEIQWVLWESTANDEDQSCDDDYEYVDEGSFDVPDCTSVGECLILA